MFNSQMLDAAMGLVPPRPLMLPAELVKSAPISRIHIMALDSWERSRKTLRPGQRKKPNIYMDASNKTGRK